MPFAKRVVTKWPVAGCTISRRPPRATPPLLRSMSTDDKDRLIVRADTTPRIEKYRQKMLDNHAKRLAAFLEGEPVAVDIKPPTRPAFQLDETVLKKPSPPQGPKEHPKPHKPPRTQQLASAIPYGPSAQPLAPPRTKQVASAMAYDRSAQPLAPRRPTFSPPTPNTQPKSAPVQHGAATSPPPDFAKHVSEFNHRQKWAQSFHYVDTKPSGLARPSDTHTLPARRDKTVFYRAVIITRLDPDCTLTDLMQAIAAAGPFGMVISASISPMGTAQRRAAIEFNTEAAALNFTAHVRKHGLRVRSLAPAVKLNTTKGFPDEPNNPHFSRVLRIVGNPTVKGFDEASLRRILADKFKRSLDDPRWLHSEPPRTSWFPDGNKVIEWPFFSNPYQTRPFWAALWQHFGKELYVGYGIDPCGNFGNSIKRGGGVSGPQVVYRTYKTVD